MKKQAQLDEINKVFAALLDDNSTIIARIRNQNLYVEEFKKSLEAYKEALIAEVHFLPEKYNHPQRAVQALAALNDPQQESNYLKNVHEFNKQANDSQFYPITRRVVNRLINVLTYCLILTIPFALAFFITAGSFGTLSVPSLLLISCTTSLLCAAGIFGNAVVTSEYDQLQKNAYQSIYNSKDKAKSLSLFFNPEARNEKIAESGKNKKTKEDLQSGKLPDILFS